MNPSDLSDEMLLSNLRAACLVARRTEAHVIRLLVEVEERRLDLRSACSSLWDFCIERLGMSESETQRRIVATRAVKNVPSLLAHLESGRVTLSTLARLAKYVTVENADELVEATRGLTRDKVEMFLAKRAPRPDVPATLRKLPDPRPRLIPGSVPEATAAAEGAEPAAPARPAAPPPRFEALSESRYRLQITASAELRDKLERARALMRHRHPTGDLARIVEAAVDLLVEKLERERLAAARAPRPAKTQPSPSRSIPRAVRRTVFARDGEQCTFVDEQGRRCASRALLEIDHIDPHARGGSSELSNLRVRCRAHNRLHAEDCFGRAHMAAKRRTSPAPVAAAATG